MMRPPADFSMGVILVTVQKKKKKKEYGTLFT